MVEQLRQLFGQHLARVWRDSEGDIWFKHPTDAGRWWCWRPGMTRPSAGLLLPIPHFGPYTELPPIEGCTYPGCRTPLATCWKCIHAR